MDNTIRETQIIKTEHGHEVKVYTYMTAKEKRQLRDIYMQDMTIDTAGSVPTFRGFKSAVVNQGEDFMIKTMVLALDGVSENLENRLQDLPAEDFQLVVETCTKIVNPEKKTGK